MGRFKVGDKVRVKNDLIHHAMYGKASFVPEMGFSKGEHTVITSLGVDCYKLKLSTKYWFTDEMLESVEKSLPREMLVWDNDEETAVEANVVYIHSNGRCAIATPSGNIIGWKHCKEISEPTTIEVTMNEIASKFGVDISNLKIKK